MIDRYQLRYFLAVIDNGNFSRAAAQCNVSQPTLSVGISKLERTIGTPLFLRTNRRVQLTQAGARFLIHARKIESEFNLISQEMADANGAALVRVGMLKSIPGDVLAQIVATLHVIDPLSQIEFVEGTERELTGHLARGRVDCALTLVGRGADRFLEEPLLNEGYSLAMALTHPHADQSVIRAEALNNDVMIVRRHCEALSETSRHFTERGVRPHFAYKATNDERVMQLVAAGLGLTVMPDSYRADNVARPRLEGFTLRRTIGLVYEASAESYAASPPPIIQSIRRVFQSPR
ncbi:LysR family transcriptional regulator [Sphingomonas bisphenolicum]|uniref:LysR family transcriptional regulator n=1 Tax=Sphingomonas bisphenolicum TaxID=296544 RepID=A0ABN5WE06_9SPHN|nr:LysR substrate-binding domain-containing protein [Sphingomonas bisphenolicum]BBF70504.1 LysR family transcriptional regulator [Sphingomonas bisphenolicum]